MDKDILCCPVCTGSINEDYYCKTCDIKFPVLRDVPILINEQNSIFSFDDYKDDEAYNFFGEKGKLDSLKKLIPGTGLNYAAQKNYEKFLKLLLEKSDKPVVLIVGGGVIGKGMEDIFKNANVEFIHTDVSYTDISRIICDGHDLPFKDGTVDGVIVQAVLEHVVDPYRCVDEVRRVLKEGGVVYGETPFMQQVHGGAYDFTRFTWLGHRRLFRTFEEIESGTCCGPGMALAWSWDYFFRSFAKGGKTQKILHLFSIFTSFYWKYFDKILKNKPNSIDASSGNYFIGRKKEGYLLHDKELIKLYEAKKKSLA